MFRWKYISQRLGLLCVIVGICWVILNPVLRTILIQGGQQLVGAKVELENLRSLLHRSKLQLDGITVADPRAPLQNLFEAETATLDIDAAALLRRRVVVKSGHIGQIQWGTPRTESGALAGAPPAKPPTDWTNSVTSTGSQWVEQAVGSLGKKVEQDLKSVSLGRELLQRWPATYTGLESDAQAVGVRGRNLVEQMRRTREQPLQSVEHYRELFRDAEQLRRDAVLLRRQLGQLNEQIRRDRVSWEQAKQHDVQYIQQHLELTKLDPEGLSNYLLGPELGGRVQQLVSWVQWGRSQFSGDEAPAGTRGVDILLPGIRPQPSLLVQQLGLDGHGRSAGQPFQFTGVLRDWTNQPQWHGKPATIEVSTQGSIQLQAEAKLDRSGDTPRDQLQLHWPRLPQPGRSLGQESFRLALGPGISELSLVLDLDGETLSGRLDYHQPEVQLQAELDGPNAGTLAPRLDQAVGAVQELRANVKLGGTLRRPTWKLTSNLGPQVASGIEGAFTAELQERQSQLVDRASASVERQLSSLQQDLLNKQQGLLKQLGTHEELTVALSDELSGLLGDKWSQDLLGNQGLLRGIFQR